MCGISGFWGTSGQADSAVRATVENMMQSLIHRGPDDAGTWVDGIAGIGLGHRRLAIVDLSHAGHQPMASVEGRYLLAYNGEIYNHLEMRDQLAAAGASPAWRGHSDTETLLAAIEYWGVIAALQRTVGMFAIALWDRSERVLHLARDRFGEKPLYFGWGGHRSQRVFAFGSELKALCAIPHFDPRVCRQSLAQFLRYSYVPAPRTIYQGVYKLEPGCLLTIRNAPPAIAPIQPLRPGHSHQSLSLRRWWSPGTLMEAAAHDPITDETDALDMLEEKLDDAVRLQSLADVPLGAFLSGGVDSSTIAALMQRQARAAGRGPIQTFTIGFDETSYDEAPHALAVARHLGTEHHEMRVSVQEAREVIATLPHMYDEPFADSSQIPTHLVCRAARQRVTVALSGDAADELFGGYNRYLWGPRVWQKVAWLPHPARRALGALVTALPKSAWDKMGGVSGVNRLGDKAHKLSDRLAVLHGRNLDDLYRSVVSEWPDPATIVRGLAEIGGEPDSLLDTPQPARGLEDPRANMMFWDTLTYLPDDILCKLDRAAMATSLETRAPFLDHRVAEIAWRLPMHMKIRGNQGKWALRQVLYRYVPRELIERPKAGFAIPIGQWLRGPLRPWAEALLGEDRLQQEGYFHAGPIRRVWAEHLSGRRDWTGRLWTVLMFQAWWEHHKGRTSR